MLSVYLFAIIVGGVLLVASFFGSHHAADGHGHEVQLDSSAHADTHAPGAHHEDSHVAVQSFLVGLLSMRVWTYLLAFGGTTGLLLRLVVKANEPTAVLSALGVGLVSGVAARGLINRAARMGRGGTILETDMIGRLATVLIPFEKSETGKVRVQVKGSTVDLLAFSDEAPGLQRLDQVLILDFRGGKAFVARSDEQEE